MPTVEGGVKEEGITEAHEIINQTSKRLSKKILELANRNRVDDENLEVGDLALIKNEYHIPGTARKLNKK